MHPLTGTPAKDDNFLAQFLNPLTAVVVALVDEDGRLLQANRGCRRLLGIADDELPLVEDMHKFFIHPSFAQLIETGTPAPTPRTGARDGVKVGASPGLAAFVFNLIVAISDLASGLAWVRALRMLARLEHAHASGFIPTPWATTRNGQSSRLSPTAKQPSRGMIEWLSDNPGQSIELICIGVKATHPGKSGIQLLSARARTGRQVP